MMFKHSVKNLISIVTENISCFLHPTDEDSSQKLGCGSIPISVNDI